VDEAVERLGGTEREHAVLERRRSRATSRVAAACASTRAPTARQCDASVGVRAVSVVGDDDSESGASVCITISKLRDTLGGVRSVRLDKELDELVRRAAAREGESVSEFLRRAASERAHRTLADRPVAQIADVIGAVHSDGGRARQTGESFADLLSERQRSR
jgi:hypothetical protein